MNTKVKTTPAAAPAATIQEPRASEKPQPKLGEIINVQVDEGVVLRNGETGGNFEPGVPTPQTVTLTVLRRLQDGDFRRVD